MVIETTVREVLRDKASKEVMSVSPDDTVYEALRQMALYNVGALLVTALDTIVGIISERDYARKVILANRTSRNTKVREIMESKVLFVTPDDPIEGCLTLMTESRVRHLPVIERGKLIGLISMGDVVKTVISGQEHMIDELTRYIWGSYSAWYDSFGPGRATLEPKALNA